MWNLKNISRRKRTIVLLALALFTIAIPLLLESTPHQDRSASIVDIVRTINSRQVESLIISDHAIVAVTRSQERLIAAKEPLSDTIDLLINIGANRERLSEVGDVRYVPGSFWGRVVGWSFGVVAFLLLIFGTLLILLIRAGQRRWKKKQGAVDPTVRSAAQSPSPATTKDSSENNITELTAKKQALPIEPPMNSPAVQWQDIAGLDEAKRELQDYARLLNCTPLLTSLGAAPRRALLLAGPRGTAKRLLTEALAKELDAKLFETSGSTYFGSDIITGAARVREIFAKARQSPRSVIMIDDLDALGKRRSNNWGGLAGAINQLIAELDELNICEQIKIIVVGTAEKLDAIDEALLEHGRFYQKIDVNLPTVHERSDLIGRYSSLRVFDESWNLEAQQSLAARTEGMSGHSICAIINDAAYRAALRQANSISVKDLEAALYAEFHRIAPETPKSDGSVSDQYGKRFRESTAEIAEDVLQQVTWAQIGGASEAKKALQEHALYLKNPEAVRRLGGRARRGIILTGPPGTGKTMLARAAATELGARFFSISGSAFVEMYVGVGAARIRHLFAQAREASSAVVFIDEIDAVGRRRMDRGHGGVEYDHALNQLLVEIDGFAKRSSILVIGATNRQDVLDPALMRGGRFERIIDVPLPTTKEREDIIRIYESGRSFDETWNNDGRDELVRATSGMSGADNRSKDLIRFLVDAGERAASERRADWDQVWMVLIAADARLARLRDDPDLRGEIEAHAAVWRDNVVQRFATPERSRTDIIALTDRIASLADEVVYVAEEARALSKAANGHGVGDEAGRVWMALLGAWDALAPAMEAAEALRQAPAKDGGPGGYTEKLRPRPVSEFGRAMVPLFRRVGIPIGGNAIKDKAFETFLDLMHQHVEGRSIPSKAKLLADLRKH